MRSFLSSSDAILHFLLTCPMLDNLVYDRSLNRNGDRCRPLSSSLTVSLRSYLPAKVYWCVCEFIAVNGKSCRRSGHRRHVQGGECSFLFQP